MSFLPLMKLFRLAKAAANYDRLLVLLDKCAPFVRRLPNLHLSLAVHKAITFGMLMLL